MSPARQPRRLEGRRVLIVEDEYMLADDMALEFKRLGAEIIGPVPTVDRGMACLRENETIDGAVLDINLNGEMVYPLAEALIARGVPFLFTTGYEKPTIPSTFQDAIVCEKPVGFEKVARALFP